jgi:hypothetical protein
VTAQSKISDLIRRAAQQINLKLTASMKPRIFFKGEPLGHGMHVGEVGVKEYPKVEFQYETDDEVL